MKEPAQKSRKDLYLEQYEESKRGGKSFFPDVIAHDALIALILIAAIFILAKVFPATSEMPADPTSTTYNPRPEWYFLFFYQFLKLFPGVLEPVAAIIIPLIVVILIFLVPLFSRGLNRSWSSRKLVVGIGIVGVLVFLSLEITGAMTAPPSPSIQENPLVIAGIQIYRERDCSYCHAINGVGGAVGPDLSTIGARTTEETLTAYLQNPSAMIPNTLHPKLVFTTDQLNDLVAYLLTLGAPVKYSPEALVLVEQHCLVCHTINGKGGNVGPALSNEGNLRTLIFLANFITDPQSEVQGATMPSFKSVLSLAQIDDIAAYLYSLRKASPPPGPTSTPTLTSTPTSTPSSTPSSTRAPHQRPRLTTTVSTPPASGGGAQLYTANCAVCHGANREGGYGPPLNPTTLGDDSDASVISTIDNGAEGMPSFASKLTPQEISDLLQYIKYTP